VVADDLDAGRHHPGRFDADPGGAGRVGARQHHVGTDDRASVTDTQRTTALNLFTSDLGPGQVSVAGATATATHAIVEAHAETFGRVALLDGTDTATVATLTTQAATDRAATGARSSGLFAPWVTMPGITAGTTRTVPPSALVRR
jgi:hypothetical protein